MRRAYVVNGNITHMMYVIECHATSFFFSVFFFKNGVRQVGVIVELYSQYEDVLVHQ